MSEVTADLDAVSVNTLEHKPAYDQLAFQAPLLKFMLGKKKIVGPGGLPRKLLRAVRSGATRTRDLKPLPVTRTMIAGYATAPYWAKSVATAVISGDEMSDAGGPSPAIVTELGSLRTYDAAVCRH